MASPGITGVFLYEARADKDYTQSKLLEFNPLTSTTFDLAVTGTVLSVVAETTPEVTSVMFIYNDPNLNFTDTKGPLFAMNGEIIGTIRTLKPVFEFNTKGTKMFTIYAYDSNFNLIDTVTRSYTVTHTPQFPPPSTIAATVPFVEQNGLVVMEAESIIPTNQFTDWKFEDDFLGYSGKGYYRFDSNRIVGGAAKGEIRYPVTITTTGRYEVLLSSAKNHPDSTWSNDCFFSVLNWNTTKYKLFANGKSYSWLYNTNVEWANHTLGAAYFDFDTPGLYTIGIYGRSTNFYLDRIVLFQITKQKKANLMQALPESPRAGVAPTVPIPAPVLAPVPMAPIAKPIMSPLPAPVVVSPPTNSALGFYFVDVKTNTILYNLKNIVNGSSYTFQPNTNLTLQANLPSSAVGIEFKYPGGKRLEFLQPFTMAGDLNGTYFNVAYLYTPGSKSIGITEYSSPTTISKQYILTFTIVHSNTAPIPPPVMAPVSVPAPVFVPAPVPMGPTSSSSLTTGKWFSTGLYNMTAETPEVCFVMVGRVAVLLGGRGTRAPYIYDPVTRTWKVGKGYPLDKIALHHMQCVVVDNKVWIMSAWTGDTPKELTPPFGYVYDPFADSWSTRTALPLSRRRGGAAAVAVGQFIYILFGNIGGHESADHATALTYTDVYDTKTDTWKMLADAKYPRDHTGGAYVTNNKLAPRICVSGGRDGGTIIGIEKRQFVYPKTVPTECYNIQTNTWSVEQDVLTAREESAYGTSCDGQLLMAGGKVAVNTGSKQFDRFDGKQWTRLGDLNMARYGSGLAVDCYCNAIYIVNPLGSPEMLSVETFFLGGSNVPCQK